VINEIVLKIIVSPPLRGSKAGMVVEFKGVTLLTLRNYSCKVLFKFTTSSLKVIQGRRYRLSKGRTMLKDLVVDAVKCLRTGESSSTVSSIQSCLTFNGMDLCTA